MTTLNISWTYPVVRDGANAVALPIDQIAGCEIAISADGGANYNVLGNPGSGVDNTVTTFQVTDAEPGSYIVRGVAIDTDGRRSAELTANADILGAPGPLQSLDVTLT